MCVCVFLKPNYMFVDLICCLCTCVSFIDKNIPKKEGKRVAQDFSYPSHTYGCRSPYMSYISNVTNVPNFLEHFKVRYFVYSTRFNLILFIFMFLGISF